MARSTGVGASVQGGARPGPDEPESTVPPVVRRKREPAPAPSRSRLGRRRAAPEPASASRPAPQPKKEPKHQKKDEKQDEPRSLGQRISSLVVSPDTDGPRVRTGVLWFFLALAAATSGRSWTAALWAVVAGVAGYQIVTVWQTASHAAAGDDEAPVGGGAARLTAAALAACLPVAASYGTGTAGALLIVAPVIAIGVHALLGERPAQAAPTVIGIVLPSLAAVSVVLAVRVDLWSGLFLILAVSLYDAGSFLLGADASGRWEGPVAGMIGALAVTFTMATFQPPPFDRATAWIAGVTIAVCCPLGQWLASAFLPSPDARATAVRRIDAYLVAGPAFVAVAWFAVG